MKDDCGLHLEICWNCKYWKQNAYRASECANPDLTVIETDRYGNLIKSFPLSKEISGDGSTPCPHFNSGFWFKIRIKYSKIKEYYYKKRYPEWFV